MNDWLRILAAVVVFAHGVGHVLFLMPAVGVAMQGQGTQSWLLTNVLGTGLTRGLGAVLWAAVIVGYLAGLAGMFTHAAWWQPLLVAASVASAIGLVMFWTNPAQAPNLSALAADAVIVVVVGLLHWPGR
jgi:hypothetical protein